MTLAEIFQNLQIAFFTAYPEDAQFENRQIPTHPFQLIQNFPYFTFSGSPDISQISHDSSRLVCLSWSQKKSTINVGKYRSSHGSIMGFEGRGRVVDPSLVAMFVVFCPREKIEPLSPAFKIRPFTWWNKQKTNNGLGMENIKKNNCSLCNSRVYKSILHSCLLDRPNSLWVFDPQRAAPNPR